MWWAVGAGVNASGVYGGRLCDTGSVLRLPKRAAKGKESSLLNIAGKMQCRPHGVASKAQGWLGRPLGQTFATAFDDDVTSTRMSNAAGTA